MHENSVVNETGVLQSSGTADNNMWIRTKANVICIVSMTHNQNFLGENFKKQEKLIKLVPGPVNTFLSKTLGFNASQRKTRLAMRALY